MSDNEDRVDFERFAAALPKAELHIHLEGTVDDATHRILCARNGRPAPPPAMQAFTDLDTFLLQYDRICAAMHSADDFHLVTKRALDRCAAGGARHVEMFFSPAAHPGLAYGTMLDGILAGFAAAEAEHGLSALLIPAHNRTLGAAAGERFLDEVLADRRPLVVGIGLDYTEIGFPPALFERLYARARGAGLNVTAHAAEVGPASHVRDTIDLLGCRRVDHGYHVLDDLALVERCRTDGIVFTCCPTTTLHTTVWRDATDPGHAVRRMIDAGLRVTLNTDDPGLFHTDLAAEYRFVAKNFGFSRSELATLALESLEAAWLPEERKTVMRKEWREHVESLG